MELKRRQQAAEISHSAKSFGSAVFITMALGLGLRVFLPRFLGLEASGILFFAESLGAMCFTFLPAGFSAYILQNAPRDPLRVQDFFPTVSYAAISIGILLTFFFSIGITIADLAPNTIHVSLTMGLYSAAFFYNRGIIRRLYLSLGKAKLVARIEIFTRLALVILVASGVLLLHYSIVFVANIFAFTELLSALYLQRISSKHGYLSGVFSLPKLKAIFIQTWPFFVAGALVDIYGNLDLTILTFRVGNSEAGLYGSAARIKTMGLLLIPIIQGSLQPALSKTWWGDKLHFKELVGQAIEWLLLISFVIGITMVVFPDIIARIMFGLQFSAASRSLAFFSAVVVLSYFNVLMGSVLTIVGSGEKFLLITGVSLALNIILNLLLVPVVGNLWGVGGSAAGAAFSVGISELLTAIMMVYVGRQFLQLKTVAWKATLTLLPLAFLAFNFVSVSGIDWVLRLSIFACGLPAYLFVTKTMRGEHIRHIWGFATGRK